MTKQWIRWIQKIIESHGWQYHFEKDKKTLEAMELLHVRENKKEKLYQIYYERIGLFILGVFVVMILGLVCFLSKPVGDLKEGYYIERGEEENNYDLLVNMEGQKENEKVQKELRVGISPKELDQEEKSEVEKQIKEYLKKQMIGKNEGLHMVSSRLYFPKTIPDLDVEIKWTVDEKYLSSEGKIKKKSIAKEGVDTTVVAKASYRNLKTTFTFPVFLCQGEMTTEEIMKNLAKNEIKKSIAGQSTKQMVELPREVGNVKLSYEERKLEKNYSPVLLAGFGLVLLPFLWREQQKKKLMKRENEMLLDHPGFVNQIMLLLSAGLTVRSAMERLVSEYEKRLEEGGSFRYAYEELWVTCNQMKNGISEEKSIEAFGKRCKMMPYLRFSAIVSQNLKKGSGGIIPLLEEDALESFQRRKEMVKRLGEEASTKMLFPMMVMLVIVMGIIMIPAFISL